MKDQSCVFVTDIFPRVEIILIEINKLIKIVVVTIIMIIIITWWS